MDWQIFYDLELMIQKASVTLFYNDASADLLDLPEFIRECIAFQMDLLRPWDRTD